MFLFSLGKGKSNAKIFLPRFLQSYILIKDYSDIHGILSKSHIIDLGGRGDANECDNYGETEEVLSSRENVEFMSWLSSKVNLRSSLPKKPSNPIPAQSILLRRF